MNIDLPLHNKHNIVQLNVEERNQTSECDHSFKVPTSESRKVIETQVIPIQYRVSEMRRQRQGEMVRNCGSPPGDLIECLHIEGY